MHKKGEKRKTRPHHPAAPRGDNKLQLKKTSRARRGARRRRRCPGAGRGRAGGSWLLPPPRGAGRGPELRPFPTAPFPTWDSLCAAQPDPSGGFCCILAAGGGCGCVCVRGERVNLCWGGDKGVFPRPGGSRSFGKGSPVQRGNSGSGRGASAGCGVKESKGTTTL